MQPIKGYHLISPGDLAWRPSNLMRIPNADYLERTGSEILGARLWRLPPRSANTLHKHVRAEEFYFVLEGTGRIRVGETSLTVPRYGGVLVGPECLRQVFNDTDSETLWLIIGAPEEMEFLQGSKGNGDLSHFYPSDPTQLPKELEGVSWPPKATNPGPRTGLSLRRPTETLAGCVWLPRFIDKCRLHSAGTLPQDYQVAFCNPHGIDGIFLRHFGIMAADFQAAISTAGTDEEVAEWFLAQSGVSPDTLRAWNELAPNIGKPGQPGERGFALARRHFLSGCTDPRVVSGFTAIAWDEGFLDDTP